MLIGTVGRVSQLPPGVSVEPVLVLKKQKQKQILFYFLSELRSCVKVEVDVLSSQSLIFLMVSVDIKQHLSSYSHPKLNCVKVEVSLIVRMVSVDVKQHLKKTMKNA